MKKILSVLLSMILVFSCCSVAFSAFAADAEVEAAVEKLNAAIETVVKAETDENGNVTHHTAGYEFGAYIPTYVGAVTVEGDTNNFLKDVLANYPEYSSFTEEITDENGTRFIVPKFDTIATYAMLQGISGVSVSGSTGDEMAAALDQELMNAGGTVKKNSNGVDTLGNNALATMKINMDNIASVSDSQIVFKDIDLVAGDKVSDSIIAQFTSEIAFDATSFYKDFVKETKANGIKIEDITCKYTNVTLDTAYDGDNLAGLTLNYSFDFSATLKYLGEIITVTCDTLSVNVSYGSFDYYDEENDFDLAELAAKINEGTAYAVDNKAGYSYTRTAAWDNEDSYIFEIPEYLTNSENGILFNAGDGLVSGFFEIYDQATVKIDDLLGTSITAYEWVCGSNCGGENGACVVCKASPCTAEDHQGDDPHVCKDINGNVIDNCNCEMKIKAHETSISNPLEKVWVCDTVNCGGENGRCEFCKETPCTGNEDPKHVCKDASNQPIKDCSCGLKNAEITGGSALVGVLTKIVDLVKDSTKSAMESLLRTGTYHTDVPAATDANEVIDTAKGNSLKKTELTVNDIVEAQIAPDGTIGVVMNQELFVNIPNFDGATEVSALNHLTDDFITLEEVNNAISASGIIEKLGGLLPQYTSYMCGVIYSGMDGSADDPTPIVANVKFVGADADNIYGTGEIESIDVAYKCITIMQIAINIEQLGPDPIPFLTAQTSAHVASEYVDFTYADYEKGDVDMSTKVSIIDAKLVLKSLVDLETLNDYQAYLADMDDNGQVSILDAKKILEKVANQTV